MLAIGHTHRLALILKDLFGLEAVTDRFVKERALHPVVGRSLAEFQRPLKRIMLRLPAPDGCDANTEKVGELAVGCAQLAELAGLRRKCGVVVWFVYWVHACRSGRWFVDGDGVVGTL